MSKDERINAVFQHACLNQVVSKQTTNASIRERFKFNQEKNTKVYRVITDAIESGKIKVANPESKSKRNIHYVPYWV